MKSAACWKISTADAFETDADKRQGGPTRLLQAPGHIRAPIDPVKRQLGFRLTKSDTRWNTSIADVLKDKDVPHGDKEDLSGLGLRPARSR